MGAEPDLVDNHLPQQVVLGGTATAVITALLIETKLDMNNNNTKSTIVMIMIMMMMIMMMMMMIMIMIVGPQQQDHHPWEPAF